MTTHPVSRKIPQVMDQRYWARNQRVPLAGFAVKLAKGLGHVIAYRRKGVMAWSQDLGSIPAGQSGDNDFLHTRFHAGVGANRLVFRIGCAQTSSGTDPYVYAKVTPDGGSSTDTDEFHYGLVTSSPDDEIDEFGRSVITYDLPAHNTTYEVAVHAVDYARPIWCAIYVESGSPVDTDDGAITPNVTSGSSLTDQWHEESVTLCADLWKYNAAHLVTWTKSQVATETENATNYTNWIDSSSTSVSITTPGYTIDTRYHRTLVGANIPVVLAARGRMQSGDNTGSIRFRNADGDSVTLEITGTTTQWHAVSGTIPASRDKFDIMTKVDAGTMELDAIVVYEYGDTLVGVPGPTEGWGTMAWGEAAWGS